MATIDGRPISVRENLLMQEIASIFELRIKNASLDNDIVKLERETGLSDYTSLKELRKRLENRHRLRQKCLNDLQNLREEIARVTDEFEDGGDPYTPIRPGGEEESEEVAKLDAKVLRLRNEYLESRRNKALARTGRGAVKC